MMRIGLVLKRMQCTVTPRPLQHSLAAGLLLVSGCAPLPTSNVVTAPGADLSALKTVAVWQFADGGKVQNSGAIASRAFEGALLQTGWRLVSYSRIRDIIAAEFGTREGPALDAGMLTPRVLDRIRNETAAQAIILGSVSDSWCDIWYTPPC